MCCHLPEEPGAYNTYYIQYIHNLKGVVKYDFTFLTLVCNVAFEHKQHYQSYNAQSSKQRKIFAFKEKVYNKRLDIPLGLVMSPTLKCA